MSAAEAILSDGPARPRAARGAFSADALAAWLALASTSVVTTAGMRRVFETDAFLARMVVVVMVAHGIGLCLRAARCPGWLAAPAFAIAGLWLLGVAYHRETLTNGVPWRATLDALRGDVAFAIDRFPTAVAPVAASGSFVVAAAGVLVAAAFLADSFAFRAGAQMEALVPTGAVFIVVSAIGVDRGRTPLALAWIAAGLLSVGTLRMMQRDAIAAWMGGRRPHPVTGLLRIAVAVTVAVGAAALAGPRLPGATAAPLFDPAAVSDNVTEVVSPLVDIRAQLTANTSRTLFTVTVDDGSTQGHYWRLASLPVFDGSAWGPPEEDLVRLDGAAPTGPVATRTVVQEIRVAALGGPLVPAAYRPSGVDGRDVFWASDSQSLVLPGGLQRDDLLRVVSEVPTPTATQLAASRARGAPNPVYTELPAGIAGPVAASVAQVLGDGSDFERLLRLQSWFRTEFTYDTDVRFGNSVDAIAEFLRERRGFCQQFAGTFAVIARAVGLPARVAVGFTPGSRTDDGRFRVTGRHAHAWPEIWFENVGWVAFEPTPGRGSPDAASYLGVPAAQDDAPVESDEEPAPDPTTQTTAPASTPAPTAAGDAPTTTASAPVLVPSPGTRSGGTVGGAPLLATALLLVWSLSALPVADRLRRWRRARREPADRVAAAWRGAVRALEAIGAPPGSGATPLEFARAVETTIDVDHRAVHELARLVTHTWFSWEGADDAGARRADALSWSIETHARDLWTLRRTVLVRLVPWWNGARRPMQAPRGPRPPDRWATRWDPWERADAATAVDVLSGAGVQSSER